MTTKNIKLIRLLTGEEIIADVKHVSKSENVVAVSKPVKLVTVQQPGSKEQKLAFAPLSVFAVEPNDTDIIDLNYGLVVAILTPIKDIEAQYIAMLSKLILPVKPTLSKLDIPGI